MALQLPTAKFEKTKVFRILGQADCPAFTCVGTKWPLPAQATISANVHPLMALLGACAGETFSNYCNDIKIIKICKIQARQAVAAGSKRKYNSSMKPDVNRHRSDRANDQNVTSQGTNPGKSNEKKWVVLSKASENFTSEKRTRKGNPVSK